MLRVSHALVALLLVGGCVLSPQPDPPGANVVASAAADYDEVVVVGGTGSVPPGAPVGAARADADGEDASEGFAGAGGSFVVVLRARPGDELLVWYWKWDGDEWVRSASRRVVVDVYDPVPPPMTYEDARSSPYAPGDGDLAGAGFLCEVYVDPPVAGLARIWALEGCVQPDVRVIAANLDTGNVVETLHAGGPFELSIPASIGDVLYLFAVRDRAPDQSSGAVRVVVPAP